MSTLLRRRFLPLCLLTILAGPLVPLRGEEKLAENLVIVQRGNLPIIISAPHGGSAPIADVPVRKGGPAIAKFVTVRDGNTDQLALKVAAELEKKLGGKVYLVIAQFDRKYLDANRPADGAYESDKAKPSYDAYHKALKTACQEVQKEYGRGLLLDLHGQGAEADTIFRGTQNGKSCSVLTQRFGKAAVVGPKSILGQMEKSGYKIFPANNKDDKEDSRYNGGYMVQTYGSHQGSAIDALQLEMGTGLRKRDRIDKTAADLAAAVEVFAKEYLPAPKKADK